MINADTRGSSVFQTTAIGSLPHHNVDAALGFAFKTSVPFLPQIPIRNPWEFMLAQALEGLPGLQAESDGAIRLHQDIWERRRDGFSRALAGAFANAPDDPRAFHAFEPGPATCSCWQPFVWELEERKVSTAKIQIAGPMTAQWSIPGISDIESRPEISTQIFRLVLARALAMTRRLQEAGVAPIIYLDEPGLYGLMPSNPRHALGLQELRLMIQTLRKEGVQVGIHCCSNTDWDAVLALGLDIISLDTALSLSNLLVPVRAARIESFISGGGRLSLGVIPTARSSVLHSLRTPALFSEVLSAFQVWKDDAPFVRKVLGEALYTPACGLALHTVSDADLVLELLLEFRDYCEASLSGGSRK